MSNPVITEVKVIRWGNTKIITNPNKQAFWNVAKEVQSELQQTGKHHPDEALVKGVLDPESGNFYIWNPLNATHGSAVDILLNQVGKPSYEAWEEVTRSPDFMDYEHDEGFVPFVLYYQTETLKPAQAWIGYEHLLSHPSIKTAIG